jgi:hypothetical protein
VVGDDGKGRDERIRDRFMIRLAEAHVEVRVESLKDDSVLASEQGG